MANVPDYFCWLHDNAGTIPTNCPEGWHRSGALCYKNCNSGDKFVAGVCWSDCPSGYTDFGATCTKCKKKKSFPFVKCSTTAKGSYIPSSVTNFDSSVTCSDSRYKSGALCYKDCNYIDMYNCGIGSCTINEEACALSIISMANAVGTSAAAIIELASSGGMSLALTAAETLTIEGTATSIGTSVI